MSVHAASSSSLSSSVSGSSINFGKLARDALKLIAMASAASAATAALVPGSMSEDVAAALPATHHHSDAHLNLHGASMTLSSLNLTSGGIGSSSMNNDGDMSVTTSAAGIISSLLSNNKSGPLPSLSMPSSSQVDPAASSDDPGPDADIRFPMYLRCSATTICLILLFCGCPGNLLVPYVVLKTKDLRNSTNIFLINLSVSDLLILLITSPTILIELHSQPEVWFLGRFMCKAVSFIEICVAHVSILTILAISFERFYAICRPLHAGYKCTKRRAFLIILLIWIIALSSTLPMIWITELQETEYMDGSIVPVCVNTLQVAWHPIYYILVFVLFFVIPFIILLILYALISNKLTSESKAIPNSNSKRRYQVRRQVVLMLASVCITFFICLLPFRLMTLWIIISTPEEVLTIGMETYYNLLFICRLLLYVNSSINPILYNLISCKFRAAFCRILNLDLRREVMKSSLQAKDSCISERFSNTMDRTMTACSSPHNYHYQTSHVSMNGDGHGGNSSYATIITTKQNNNTLSLCLKKQHSFRVPTPAPAFLTTTTIGDRASIPVDVHSL